uniref:thialysine N-epsilon-acetyltransferase-like n=1 Tax=Pristiophorus japonicus TaxID=55135 RepID=UPI00398F624C
MALMGAVGRADWRHVLETTPHPRGLRADGFSADPFYKCLVAEVPAELACRGQTIVGYAMYFFTYTAWKGRALYLEDLYVMDECRGKGIGGEFLRRIAEIAIQNKCSSLQFVVLNENRPSIEFYIAKGADDMTKAEGWHLFRFEREQLEGLAGGKPPPEQLPLDITGAPGTPFPPISREKF